MNPSVAMHAHAIGFQHDAPDIPDRPPESDQVGGDRRLEIVFFGDPRVQRERGRVDDESKKQ
jgi:hypothetical protein